MLVHPVVMPVSGAESWTVVSVDGVPLAPVEDYLAFLAALDRSPNTVRAYAISLKLWFEFLDGAGIGWADAGVNEVVRFVASLRSPAENVSVLDNGVGMRTAATVNRHLAGVFGFYEHHARAGVALAADLVAWRRVSRGSYKPFLHHATQGKAGANRTLIATADSTGQFRLASNLRMVQDILERIIPALEAIEDPDRPDHGH